MNSVPHAYSLLGDESQEEGEVKKREEGRERERKGAEGRGKREEERG